MRILLLFFLGIIFQACKHHKTNVSIHKLENSVLVDTGYTSTDFIVGDNGLNGYPIYYLGATRDTIRISKPYQVGETLWDKYIYLIASKTYSSKKLKLFVDTSIKSNSYAEYLSEDWKIIDDSSKNFHSYLLSMKNISDSTIKIGYTFNLYFAYREAKDRNGKWVIL